MIKPHLTLIVNIKFFSQLLPFPFKIFMSGKEIFRNNLANIAAIGKSASIFFLLLRYTVVEKPLYVTPAKSVFTELL
jgi:hypothetical protein